MRSRRLTWTCVMVAGALAFAACGKDDAASPPTTPGTPVTGPGTGPDGTVAATGGWVDGEPAWRGSGGGEFEEAADGALAASDDDSGGRSTAAPALGAPAPGAAVDSDTAGGDIVEPEVSGPLRAGSVDDNADFDRFLAYLDRIASLGVSLRDFDPSGRVVVSVVGANGLPVAGAEIVVSAADAEVARLRTTADGTARFHPIAHGSDAEDFVVTVGGVSSPAAPGDNVDVVLDGNGGAAAPVPLDVLFLLDATGSMGDEIDQLKVSIDSVSERIAALEGAPDVRFGMTLYRDEGDAFVAATYDFTSDVDAFRAALADVVADGGGDYPEALDEGLAEALTVPSWRDPATTVQHVFLVADAPPQVGRQVDMPYPDSIREAVGRGIKIFPVASSESDDQAEAVFRQLAQTTGARFVFLAYGAGGAATGGSTDIDRTDYEELALDDLVVRLVAEDLAALTGDPGHVPPPTPTTTTVPDGQ